MTLKGPIRWLAAALLAVTALALALAPRADGGTYTAVQCHEPLGAGRADASFTRNSGRYVPSVDCSGRGLGVTHDPGRDPTSEGGYGAWTLAAPAGTAIVRAGARVSAAARDGHVPQMFVTVAGGARRYLSGVRGRSRSVSWSGTGWSLTGRLGCSRRRCGPGDGAHLHLRRLSLTLRDAASPSLDISGSLLAAGARRGLEALYVQARDAGGGVRAIAAEVNGDPLPARVFKCELRSGFALRLQPCPAAEDAWFVLETTSPRFRQGPNRVRVCVSDHARRSDANRACAARTVRVDNQCPLSAEPGARLEARFHGAGSTLATRSNRPASVAGRLRDANGAPVAGARVCVATRAGKAAERVIATPFTNGRGEFIARIPAGPSRAVRVAHWPSDERALEQHLTLRSRAVPRLRLRPKRVLKNGETLRFKVRIPGPGNARRHVFVQARAGRRWVKVADGRTSAAGAWRGRYRFRSTTGTRRYAFRAVVPKQAGYPYEGGRSRVVRATVSG
jgi:hypothetical protein